MKKKDYIVPRIEVFLSKPSVRLLANFSMETNVEDFGQAEELNPDANSITL
ncbi:MAG: hypothetical protein SOW66_05355 [Porphyromonas sp.]|nr:hypothetical protein [Porphyromonas sp.]